MNENAHSRLRALPGVDRMLQTGPLREACRRFGTDLVKPALQQAIARARAGVLAGGEAPTPEALARETEAICRRIAGPSLRPVINATGIMIHTNLGRVPLGERIFAEMREAVTGYCNLEFDLATGSRGHRKVHLEALLCHLTGAEAALVVNNNAAALVLALSTLAAGREVIVSRGELIEIGGSFRIPDILAASGARMVEVGTTNRTRLQDYERAITPQTAMLFKAHKSNYAITGFTEEVSLPALGQLGRDRALPVLYDIGSGLLRKPARIPLPDEPDVRGALAQGVDLLTFSGDKLLGGPQAGILAGRRDLLGRLERAPLMRAFRVGKLTIAALAAAARAYLSDERLVETLPLFAMLDASPESVRGKAEALRDRLARRGIASRVVDSIGRCGGGTLPDLEIASAAVALTAAASSQQKRSAWASALFHALLALDRPVLAVLRGGELLFDALTLAEADLDPVATAVAAAAATLDQADPATLDQADPATLDQADPATLDQADPATAPKEPPTPDQVRRRRAPTGRKRVPGRRDA
ncbi:MAG: L-seryl-tRNA(Sec) selenium transferase [Candidatus Riflebacteria bacterium]|nr:L-seryl-tRNA(Sec) selenium transferase [Candidatus Riflebacteria bacterium]